MQNLGLMSAAPSLLLAILVDSGRLDGDKEPPIGTGLGQPTESPGRGARGFSTPTSLLLIAYLWFLWVSPTGSPRPGIPVNRLHASPSARAMQGGGGQRGSGRWMGDVWYRGYKGERDALPAQARVIFTAHGEADKEKVPSEVQCG